MSFKETRELSKAGKLDEALQMAKRALEADPGNIWNKRATAWVYYDYLKKFAQPNSFEAFIENLIKIKDLQLPEDEKMVFDNCAWQIGSLVFGLKKAEHVDYAKINELFEVIIDFKFTKPSEAYSFIFKAFHKGNQSWSSYLTFADWWNFDNFRPEDYLMEEFNDKKIMSIAEQAYIAYARHLMETYKPSAGQQSRKEKIKAFIPKLEQLINSHPEYQYPPYFLAKLLLETGNEENSLSAIIPFALKKQNEFWVWDAIAGAFPDNPDMKISCYCRALLCPAQDKYLIKLRQTFAGLLINKKMYQEAKTEIENIIRVRNENNWDIPEQIRNWINQSWYQSTRAFTNNLIFYQNNAHNANELIYLDIPEETVAVEFVNQNKKILNFIDSNKRQGFFRYDKFIRKVNVGDLLLVRLKPTSNEGLFKALSIKKSENTELEGVLKKFSGELHIPDGKDFGFVGDIFISPVSINKMQLVNGQKIQGRAVISFNKLRGEWGWKGIVLEK